MLLAWPSAEVSFMSPHVAVNVVYGRKLRDSADPASEHRQLVAELQSQSAPWEAAGLHLISGARSVHLIPTLILPIRRGARYRCVGASLGSK